MLRIVYFWFDVELDHYSLINGKLQNELVKNLFKYKMELLSNIKYTNTPGILLNVIFLA